MSALDIATQPQAHEGRESLGAGSSDGFQADLDEILDSALAEVPDDLTGHEDWVWPQLDDRTLGFAVRKSLELQAELAEIDRLAAARIAEIQEWQALRASRIEKALSYLGHELRVHLERTGKKSIDLPEGRARLRKMPLQFERDEAQVLEWVKEAGLPYRRVQEKLDWAGLKGRLTVTDDGVFLQDTGERVDIIKAHEPAPKLEVVSG